MNELARLQRPHVRFPTTSPKHAVQTAARHGGSSVPAPNLDAARHVCPDDSGIVPGLAGAWANRSRKVELRK